MIFAVGATSQSVDVQIVDDTGVPVDNLTAGFLGTFPSVYAVRAGAYSFGLIVLHNLSSDVDPWEDGGLFPRLGGYYRLDLPDSLFSVEGEITLIAEESGKRMIAPKLEVGAVPTANENADALIGRNIAGGSSTGRTVKQALSVLRNKVVISGNTLTVYDTDDTTVLYTATLTSDISAVPITAVDPG